MGIFPDVETSGHGSNPLRGWKEVVAPKTVVETTALGCQPLPGLRVDPFTGLETSSWPRVLRLSHFWVDHVQWPKEQSFSIGLDTFSWPKEQSFHWF